jgi:hypothetical protein
MVTVTIPDVVTVTVQDTDGASQEGLPVYVFDEGTYTGYHGSTDGSGEVQLTLPQGDYRFRADLNGTQFWSGETNHCAIPGCLSASITVTIPVTVAVQSQTGDPPPDFPACDFDSDSYTRYHGAPGINGEVKLALLRERGLTACKHPPTKPLTGIGCVI